MGARMASASQVAAAKEAIIERAFDLVEVMRKRPDSDDAITAWSELHRAVNALGAMSTPGET